MSVGRNPARSYYAEGLEIVKDAVRWDRMGNLSAAKYRYQEALSKFRLAKGEKPQFVAEIATELERVTVKCQERVNAIEEIFSRHGGEVMQAPLGSANAPVEPAPPHSPSAGPKGPSAGGKTDQGSDEFMKKMEQSILVEHPNMTFDSVAGLADAKRSLEEAMVLPMKFPQLFTGQRAPWRGILLYGPPGTGKSFLAKAAAGQCGNSTFLTVSTSDLMSKWLGESEKLIRALFDVARERKPAVIFIDEIDSILGERTDNDSEASRRIKTEFLVQIDGVGKTMDGVLLLAATNLPWSLDPAVRRRFEKRIYIPLPDLEAREYMVKMHMRDTPNAIQPAEFHDIAVKTEGYSGADLKILSREASFVSVRKLQIAEYFCEYQGKMWPCNPEQPGAVKKRLAELDPNLVAPPPVLYDDYMQALMKVRPSVSQGDLGRYEKWTKEYGEEG